MGFETEIPILEMLARLGAAAGLTMLIGIEREIREKPAGLRSHMLVGLGSCAFMLVGLDLLQHIASADPSARIDPTRVVEGVVGGIGFLGAGSIIRSGANINGITTGAAIWTAGAIGVACGAGNLILASLLTGFALIVVVVLGHFEREVIVEKHRRDA